ncbi:hypothetical protein LTR84_001677 [Exophiala bonariae]|uniref:Zn(2)-C6 fungal-type domain-containing protein n=1 Tax=Exophiala bonariae TaxID=1690606 RepID=A0AAV9NB41_9EURO|nr:hypothetical protein LTR84_001677 [Exophiala bonariae]
MRPSCGQCIIRGVTCKGYPNVLNIRFEDPGAKYSESSIAHEPESKGRAIVLRKTPPDIALSILPQACNATAFRHQMYGCYLEEYLPRSSGKWPDLQTDLQILPCTSWLHTANAVPSTNLMLTDALMALSLSHLGQSEHKIEFLEQSQTSYFRAVHGLNKAFEREERVLEDDTLATVMALSIYEMSSFKQPYYVNWRDFRSQMQGASGTRAQGWISHIRGAQALVQMRGQQNFSNAFSEKLFLGTRLTEFISAIGRRKASPSALLWSTVHTWSGTSSHVQLFEILQALPGIMEVADKITPPDDPVEMSADEQSMYQTLFDSLSTQTVQLEGQLDAWYATLKSQNQHHYGGELYYKSPSTLYQQLPRDSPIRDLPFNYFLCFVDPDIAQQVVLHWAGLVLLRSTHWLARGRLARAGLLSLLSTMDSQPIALSSIPPTGHTKRPPPPEALLIAQSLEYFVHPDMGFLGLNFIGFPMAVAQGPLEFLQAPEVAWFDVIFERMHQMKSGLGAFLDEMAHGTGDTQLRLLKV